jgi:putative serine protease PepD
LASAIALVVAASVIGAFLLLDDDQPSLVSLGGGSGVVGGENLSLRGEALNVQGVLSVVSPSVVSIETNVESFRGVFGGSGSGIVVDTNGLILTNAHVIEDADEVEVVFFDGTRAPATVVSSIVAEDVALIQVQGVTDTLPATLGTADQLLVGDQVLAIGNALGLGGDPTVTLGILSAKNRQIDAGRLSFENLLQTDAAINPGNSGGPLVNAAGEVIGINTAIIEGSQNVGFAIAIDSVMDFLEGFAEGDASLTPDTAWFGASSRSIATVPEDQQQAAGVDVDAGVFIIDVFEGSAADRAGLEPGDVITGINGASVSTPEDVARIIRRLDPGNVIDIDFSRRGAEQSANVSLGTRADASNGD